VVGRLFSSQSDSKNKTEIILLITPRIVRNLEQPQGAGVNIPAGSENAVGFLPLQLKATAPGNLGLSFRANGSVVAGAQVQAAERPAATAEPGNSLPDISGISPFDVGPDGESLPAKPGTVRQ
jgi:general secretion pathway protein D